MLIYIQYRNKFTEKCDDFTEIFLQCKCFAILSNHPLSTPIFLEEFKFSKLKQTIHFIDTYFY
jgi:hypothetical protein